MTKTEKKIWVNWSGNLSHSFRKKIFPKSELEIIQSVISSEKIRVIGSGHSTSDITAGTETLIDLANYNKVISINNKLRQITVQTGMTLSVLLQKLSELGWCLPCLPDVDTITVGGAIATGTHGTGKDGHIISEYIVGCRLIRSNGTILEAKREDDLMNAIKVSVGVLGVFSEVTFQCEEEYLIHIKEEPLKDHIWLEKFDTFAQEHNFFRVLWLPHTNYGYVATGNKVLSRENISHKNGPRHLKFRRSISTKLYNWCFGYPRASVFINKFLFLTFYNFKKERVGSLYDTTVIKARGKGVSEMAEWTVSRDKFKKLFIELKDEFESKDNDSYAHLPVDIRILKSDESWLSYAYKRDIVTVGLTCRVPSKVEKYTAFKTIEEIFLKYGGRPHWAKKFNIRKGHLSKIYPKWSEFIDLRNKLDPNRKFLNSYLEKLFT